MLLTSEQNKHVWRLHLTVLPYFLMCSMSNALFVVKSNTVVISGNCYYVDTPKTNISTNLHAISTYFFRRNFDGRKIHVVSTYFFQCNFFHRNIDCVSTYFFRHNFDVRIIHFICIYFLRQNFDEFDVVVCKL